MNKLHLDILNELRNEIIDDIDVYNDILRPLESQDVLRKKDVEKINSGQTREGRSKILLDILSSCSRPYAFNVFHEALLKHYPWLSSDIDNILRSKHMSATNNGCSISPDSPNLPSQLSFRSTQGFDKPSVAALEMVIKI